MAKAKRHPSKHLAAVRPVESLIRVIRGQKVMLDADLAELYGVTTGNLNLAVRRNIERFPSEFMFPVTAKEAENLKLQSASSSWGGRRRSFPHAFTQEGVAMLSSVLRSPRAVQMNISIMKAFVRVREMIAHNKDLASRMEKLEHGHKHTGSVIEVIIEDIDRLAHEIERIKNPPAGSKRKIGYIHFPDD
jgi:hypothetical protein